MPGSRRHLSGRRVLLSGPLGVFASRCRSRVDREMHVLNPNALIPIGARSGQPRASTGLRKKALIAATYEGGTLKARSSTQRDDIATIPVEEKGNPHE